jgi:predicted AlkP superfamily pyrophosphatase or phosphodiesterase
MNPSFPSLTFPNHFTLVTGLHPESHGIVANEFWDPNSQKSFYYTDPSRSMQEEWWNAEPLWEVAELQGVRSAIHMWPGSEAPIGEIQPTYVDKFNGKEILGRKVDRILGLLDIPGPNDQNASKEAPRPQLIAAYVPNVDSDGHRYGPNSTYIRSTIAEVDGMVQRLLDGIEARNLTNVVNIVIVSDHGMATTSNKRMVQLEDLVDRSLIEYTDGWPLFGLRPFNTSEDHLHELYQRILAKSKLSQYQDAFDVYLRDDNMPDKYHYAQNDRIAPLWVVPRAGWAVVSKDEFNIEVASANNQIYMPRGLHGYDNEHPLMRAIFIARGPAFPNMSGNLVEPFQNTEVYGIVCDSLGLEPRPNNGTIRLPLKIIGYHTDADSVDIPHDPDDHAENVQIMPPNLPGIENLPPVPTAIADQPVEPVQPIIDVQTSASTASDGSSAAHVDESPPPLPEIPVPRPEVKPEKESHSWLDWFNEKLDKVKHWATDVFGTHKEVEDDS